MFKNGIEKEIIMDDHIPCRDGRTCFSQANGDDIWVQMLEKAWAKVHGCYERIANGFPQNALRDLTGAPSFSIDVTEPGMIDRLIDFNEAGFILTASRGAEEYNPVEMSQHAYGVLQVKQITDKNM